MARFGIFLTLLFACRIEADIFTPDQEADIEAFVENIRQCRDVPGLSLSVVKGDESWARGFGFADLEAERRVDNETLLPIASLSKAFTMTLLGRYLEQEGFDWDTKLLDLVGFPIEFPDESTTNEVTIADLLSHQTGLAGVDLGFVAGYGEGTTRLDMSRKIKYVPTIASHRETWSYNNLMYMELGLVTEVLGRDSWEDLMTKRLFEPIGMESSTVIEESDDVLKDDIVNPLILRHGDFEIGTVEIYNIRPLEPAGSILSNGLDMAKWMQFNLNNATTDSGASLLEPDFFQEAFMEKIGLPARVVDALSIGEPTFPVNDTTTGYGYAWFTSTYRGHRRLWHSGGFFSYLSLLWLFPEQDIGLFATINGPAIPGSFDALRTLFWYLSDVLLDETPWLTNDTACTFPAQFTSQPSSPVPDFRFLPPDYTSTEYQLRGTDMLSNDNLTDYVGTYYSDLLPEVTIYMSEENSTLKFEMNRVKGDLIPTRDEDILAFEMVDPWEYAIERVVNDNLTIPYPVVFERLNGSDVTGFSLVIRPGIEIQFRNSGHMTKAVPIGVLFVISLAMSYLTSALPRW